MKNKTEIRAIFETFFPFGPDQMIHYMKQDPYIGDDGDLRIKRFRVTIEEVEEPESVYQDRILSLYERSKLAADKQQIEKRAIYYNLHLGDYQSVPMGSPIQPPYMAPSDTGRPVWTHRRPLYRGFYWAANNTELPDVVYVADVSERMVSLVTQQGENTLIPIGVYTWWSSTPIPIPGPGADNWCRLPPNEQGYYWGYRDGGIPRIINLTMLSEIPVYAIEGLEELANYWSHRLPEPEPNKF